jgi:hypothetical protein
VEAGVVVGVGEGVVAGADDGVGDGAGGRLTRAIVSRPQIATHSVLNAASAAPQGGPSSAIVAAGAFVFGSIRVIVCFAPSVTQTPSVVTVTENPVAAAIVASGFTLDKGIGTAGTGTGVGEAGGDGRA